MKRVRWVAVPVVALLASLATPAGAAPAAGNDISFPQCGGSYPATPAFGIVGVNDGIPYSTNPCLVAEYRWALKSGVVEFYLNTANPGVAAGGGYAYGFNAARDAYTTANARVSAGPGHLWWLDVETANSWSDDQGANTAVIGGAIAFLRSQAVTVGVYSTVYQWGVITGGARIPSVPNWVPGAQSAAAAPTFCAARRSFSGGPVVMTQYTTHFDYDVLCPGVALPAPLKPPPPNLLQAILNWLATL
jgi:hypothetical protein